MYIVENMVFYSCGKLDIKKIKSIEDLNRLNIIKNTDIQFVNYWFDRLDTNSDKYLRFDFTSFGDIFNKNLDVDNMIEKLVIKVHVTGISSVEIYFKLDGLQIGFFDKYLDSFTLNYSKEIFELVYKINFNLNKESIIEFSSNYLFSTIILEKKTSGNEYNLSNLKNPYLFRVHYFTQDSSNYERVRDFYKQEKIKSDSTIVELDESIYETTIYKTSVLWRAKKIQIEDISKLLDIDSHTMNESVIYKQAGETYTNLMYKIDFESKNQIASNKLFEMHKINSFFLQKSRLAELSYSENVNGFMSLQRSIEKFDSQEGIFLKSEKNFLDVYGVVEANEKAKASKVVQYILVFLTLFTIVSVSKDIIEFIDLEFYSEKSLKIDTISKVELLSFLAIFILIIFFRLREYIKRS